MTDRSRASASHRPAARRRVGRRRTVRSSRGPGAVIVILALLLVALVAGVAWMTRRPTFRPVIVDPPRPTPPSRTGPPAPEPSIEPTAQSISPTEIGRCLDAAPLLTPAAARALLEDARGRETTLVDPLAAALSTASVSFGQLDRETLNEISMLLDRAWLGGTPAEQLRIEAYLDYVRGGMSLTSDEVDEGRALVAEAIGRLTPPDRDRLAKLFGMAVMIGLQKRREGEERARLAALAPAPGESVSLPPRPSTDEPVARSRARTANGPKTMVRRAAAGDRGRDVPSHSERGEAYWRKRAESARKALTRAQARVEKLEAKAQRLGPFTPGFQLPECQAGARMRKGEGVVAFRDRTRGARTCDSKTKKINAAEKVKVELEEARAELEQAKKAYEDLLEEGRRARALPGWFR